MKVRRTKMGLSTSVELFWKSNAITEGSLFRAIIDLFLPLAFSMVFSSLIGICDMFIAGEIGNEAQAAVGLGDQLVFLMVIIGTGLSTACTAFVSQSFGARDSESVKRYAVASLALAGIVGIVASVLGFCFAESLVALFSCTPQVAKFAVPYTAQNSIANAPFIFLMCEAAIFRAIGRPILSVYVQVLTSLIAIVISVVLFYSNSFCGRSLDALAVGWITGACAGAVWGAVILWKTLFAQMRSSLFRSVLISDARKISALAFPAILAELGAVLAIFLVYRMLSIEIDSASSQAAFTIKLKIEESVALIPLMALGMSSAVVVGQNLGAGNAERAFRACKNTSIVSAVLMLILGITLSFSSPALASLFSSDITTRECISNYVAFSFLLFPLTAAANVLVAGLEGAGYTQVPMILNFSILVFVRCGLAYVFAFLLGMGATGIAIAYCVSQLLMLVCVRWTFMWKFRVLMDLAARAERRLDGFSTLTIHPIIS